MQTCRPGPLPLKGPPGHSRAAIPTASQTPALLAGPIWTSSPSTPGGEATSQIDDGVLTWADEGDHVRLEQDDITVEVHPMGARSFAFGDLEATLLVAHGMLPDGQTLTTGHFVVEADPGLTLSNEDIPGRYRLMSPVLAGAYLQLDAGGTGWAASLDGPNDPRPEEGGRDFQWEILESGDLLLKILPRDSTFVQATVPLRPVQQTPAGLYAIQRLGFGDTPHH